MTTCERCEWMGCGDCEGCPSADPCYGCELNGKCFGECAWNLDGILAANTSEQLKELITIIELCPDSFLREMKNLYERRQREEARADERKEYIVVRFSDMSGIYAFTTEAESMDEIIERYDMADEAYHIQEKIAPDTNGERVTHIPGELSYLNQDTRTNHLYISQRTVPKICKTCTLRCMWDICQCIHNELGAFEDDLYEEDTSY